MTDTRTLVICKPDAVERGLCGEIIGRLERKGLRLVAVELRHIDAELAKHHYEEHIGRPFFERLVTFITRSPLLAMVVEGPQGSWETVRLITGATNPAQAAPGTIRGDLALSGTENLIHASDGPESAEREIALWFPALASPAAGGE
jgi:nucleoside-diphosphate kinase